jgi:coproporphyrinogen III oxidase
MAKTIYREHHWPPSVIGGLYVDDIDYQGIEYIFNDIQEVYKATKKK